MDLWIYMYVIIAIVLIVGLWGAYTQCISWWDGNRVSCTDKFNSNIYEIFLYENSQHHLLRAYTIELCSNHSCAEETVALYKENAKNLLMLWEKVLKKEHFYNFVDLQRQRWNLHLSIVENMGSQSKSEMKELRIINRKISQLHEDWWGLKFGGTEYMRSLNEMDTSIFTMVSHASDENYKDHMKAFHNVMYHQETAENKIKAVV